MKWPTVGKRIVCLKRVEAYYSKYGPMPECFLELGDLATVKSINIPPVVGRGPNFLVAEFEKYGIVWRVALNRGEYREVEQRQ